MKTDNYWQHPLYNCLMVKHKHHSYSVIDLCCFGSMTSKNVLGFAGSHWNVKGWEGKKKKRFYIKESRDRVYVRRARSCSWFFFCPGKPGVSEGNKRCMSQTFRMPTNFYSIDPIEIERGCECVLWIIAVILNEDLFSAWKYKTIHFPTIICQSRRTPLDASFACLFSVRIW